VQLFSEAVTGLSKNILEELPKEIIIIIIASNRHVLWDENRCRYARNDKKYYY